jgi:hypothetical protein
MAVVRDLYREFLPIQSLGFEDQSREEFRKGGFELVLGRWVLRRKRKGEHYSRII